MREICLVNESLLTLSWILPCTIRYLFVHLVAFLCYSTVILFLATKKHVTLLCHWENSWNVITTHLFNESLTTTYIAEYIYIYLENVVIIREE